MMSSTTIIPMAIRGVGFELFIGELVDYRYHGTPYGFHHEELINERFQGMAHLDFSFAA